MLGLILLGIAGLVLALAMLYYYAQQYGNEKDRSGSGPGYAAGMPDGATSSDRRKSRDDSAGDPDGREAGGGRIGGWDVGGGDAGGGDAGDSGD